MECQEERGRGRSDSFELVAGDRPFDASATAWLVGEAVRHLHRAGEEATLAYQHVTEVLRGRDDAVETLARLSHEAGRGDTPLRWSVLFVLGDVGDQSAGDLLVGVATERLPEAERGGCEGPRDAELLVRTMAVEALQRIAGRHPEVAEHLLKIVAERPARPVLIEAVKAAGDLGLTERVRGLVPAADHWILDIRRARIDEVQAEPERKDGNERGFTPPILQSRATAPAVGCCPPMER